MEITTDKYVDVKFYEDSYFSVKIDVYEELKDFISEHGEFLDKIPYFEDVKDMYELDEKLRESNFEYYYLNSQDFDIIPEGYEVVSINTDEGTIVIVGRYGEIKLIGKLSDMYDPSDPVYLVTRIFVGCDDFTLEVVNEGYDYYTFVFSDGTVITTNNPEYTKILERIRNCEKVYFGTIDL